MVENLEIIEKEDESLNELLNKTAKELHQKYTKQRKIKEKFLKKKTPLQKTFSIIFDVVCIVMVLCAFVVCFATINCSINGSIPSFAGYTNMRIASKSMEKSGFYVGDAVIIHSVKPETLNVGDKIAFYVHPKTYNNVVISGARNVSDKKSKTDYSLTISQLFGFQTDSIKAAVKDKSKLVFHHIDSIYEDENGVRWFKTKGSSNPDVDDWLVREDLIVGIQDESFLAKTMVWIISLTFKPYGIIFLMVPAGIMLVSLVIYFIRNMQIAKLELDCVEEKRKITDPICVKNNVGYQMSTKTKYKILAQATDKNREEYIRLLWKDGNEPDSVKKYYLRKKILLQPVKEMLKLNRTCEKKFKAGENPNKIAKYYLEEKSKIKEREAELYKKMKAHDRAKAKSK